MQHPPTLLHALHERASSLADRPALWTKKHGYYLPLSWRDYAARVRGFALGLLSLGVKPGATVGIMGFNREEWLVAHLGSIAVGAVPVGIYATSSPEQIQYLLGHCEADLVVVENEAYLARVREVRARLPKLRHVLVMDAPASAPDGALAYQEVLASGTGASDGPYWDRINALEPNALATLIYTSGTTGTPKGVMLSHTNQCWTGLRLAQLATVTPQDLLLSYLPLAHVAEQVGTIYSPLLTGSQVYFAESFEKVPENLREVRPTLFFGVPRVWEKMKVRAEERMKGLSPRRASLLRWARDVTRSRHARALAHERVPYRLELQYQAASRTVFAPLKEKIGLERARVLVTSAAPISADVLDFFASVDLVIREIYGQSEVTGPTSVNTLDETKLGALGRPMLGVEVRIADDGEILVRGPNVCMGYYKDPAATQALLQDGWLHSGDLGEMDPDGYLHITGRKKEIIVTSGGKKTSPATIEGMLKDISPVGHAVVVGERRNYLVALLALDPEKVPAFARDHGWPQEPAKLATHPPFLEYLHERVEAEANRRLSRFETIKRFAVLPRDLSMEEGELTPTLKVKRQVVEQKHRDLIDSLYAHGDGQAKLA